MKVNALNAFQAGPWKESPEYEVLASSTSESCEGNILSNFNIRKEFSVSASVALVLVFFSFLLTYTEVLHGEPRSLGECA